MNNKEFKLWVFNEGEIKHWGVQFIDGVYNGVVVEVLNFTSKDHQDGDTFGDLLDYAEGEINLSIEYGILHKPDDMDISLIDCENFKSYFQDVIGEVIKETAKSYDKNRDDNFKEFDSQ